MTGLIATSTRAWMLLALLSAAACATEAGESSPPSSTLSTMQNDIRQTGSALVQGLRFDAGQSSWPPSSIAPLQQVLAMLQQHSEWRFDVQVHTDELGDRDADQELAKRRAEAIVAWLTARGIEPSRLVAHGLGSSQPRSGHAAAESSTRNRWVELRKLNEE